MEYENERIIMDETISHSDEDDDDENSDDDDYDDEETTSWLDDIRSSWRQHCVAILIAVLATAFAYMYRYLVGSPIIISSKYSGRELLHFNTSDISDHHHQQHPHYQPHEFLQRLERTANVSFCGTSTSSSNATDQTLFLSDFDTMDFHLSKDLVHAMALHFQIDLLQEDDVSTYLISTGMLLNNSTGSSSRHDEIQCILRLSEYATQDYIKGYTYFYKRPHIESMYRTAQSHRLEPSTLDVHQPTKKDRKSTRLNSSHVD